MKMNEQIKQNWIEALLSGEYEQGHDMLRNGDTYCCLGVLCDLYIKSHDDLRWNEYGEIVKNDDTFVCNISLPKKVIEWANLERYGNSAVLDRDNEGYLILLPMLNDGANGFESCSFQEIAAVIEEKL